MSYTGGPFSPFGHPRPQAADGDDDASPEERELSLYADNTAELYPGRQARINIMKKRIQAGTYDPALAPKLWRSWYDEAAKSYAREFGGAATMFTGAMRNRLAAWRARYEYGEILLQAAPPARKGSARVRLSTSRYRGEDWTKSTSRRRFGGGDRVRRKEDGREGHVANFIGQPTKPGTINVRWVDNGSTAESQRTRDFELVERNPHAGSSTRRRGTKR